MALSLPKTIKTYPAIGWVRGNHAASADLHEELNAVRKENAALKELLAEVTSSKSDVIEDLAGLDESFTIHGVLFEYDMDERSLWEHSMTFGEIFAVLSPYVLEHSANDALESALTRAVFQKTGRTYDSAWTDDQDMKTIILQFKALGLIERHQVKVNNSNQVAVWRLTPRGEQVMTDLRIIRKGSKSQFN